MEVLGELKKNLQSKTVILGIGNLLKSDDGFGTILAGRLEGKVKAEVFAAGVIPENYLEKIVKIGPQTILIIDAADFGGGGGEGRFQTFKAG